MISNIDIILVGKRFEKPNISNGDKTYEKEKFSPSFIDPVCVSMPSFLLYQYPKKRIK
jgi:hypothetical protein